MDTTRILVVDDEALVLESVRLTLAHCGYAVETAAGGPEALSKLAAGEFHIVITDQRMPGMTGAQLAVAIKERWPNMPVVLLTGFPPDAKPRGVDLVLLKPFSTAELRSAVHRLAGPPGNPRADPPSSGEDPANGSQA